MKSIKAWNGTIELEWNWNKQTNKLFLVKDSQALISHTEKNCGCWCIFIYFFLKLCKKKKCYEFEGLF